MKKSTYICLYNLYRFKSFIFFIVKSQNSSFEIFADGVPEIRVRNLSEVLSILPAESRVSLATCMDKSTATRSIGEVEFFFGDVANGRRWFLAKFVPTEPGNLHCVFMDITSLKAREERTKLILGEFAHRIKNSMTMVQSIARLTLKSARPDGQALAVFQARLTALANAQNLLIRNDWQGASLSDVVDEATRPFDRELSPFHITGEEILISSRFAKAMIFALHELCTNALKYGALSTRDGQISVSWRVLEIKGVRTLFFSWREQHGPAIHGPPARRGFGTRMIERWLAQETGGTATLGYREEGLIFEFNAPFSAIEDAIASANFDAGAELIDTSASGENRLT